MTALAVIGAGWLTLAVAASAAAPVPAADEFHFVVLGDAQFDDPATFNRMIDDITHLRPAFVVQVGDMIDGYAGRDDVAREWQRFRHQIEPLADISYVPVPGNHDLYNAERRSDLELQALYEAEWGPAYRSFDYRNARFVILNSDAPGEERSIGPAQWRWLERTLTENPMQHVFVFMHRPPASLTNAQALHALLQRYPVRYVFYGHLHHYHYFERDGIRYVMTNAAADTGVPLREVGGFPHLLLVSVRDDEARYAVLEADALQAPDSADPADNQDLFDLSRALVPAEIRLESQGSAGYRMTLPLANPTSRPLVAYVSCTSEDQRWQFQPAAVAPIALAPDSRERVSLTVSYAVSGTPESQPECRVQVPFQTRFGEWLPFESVSRGTLAGPD